VPENYESGSQPAEDFVPVGDGVDVVPIIWKLGLIIRSYVKNYKSLQ
jgi:hypothetical protein